jgi:hypothetical protein
MRLSLKFNLTIGCSNSNGLGCAAVRIVTDTQVALTDGVASPEIVSSRCKIVGFKSLK